MSGKLFCEIHVLRNDGYCNLNRDQDGNMKRLTFGMIERSRISSQAQRHVIRTEFRDGGHKLVTRTRHIILFLIRRLIEMGFNAEDAKSAATNTMVMMGFKNKKKKKAKKTSDGKEDEATNGVDEAEAAVEVDDEAESDDGIRYAVVKNVIHYTDSEFNRICDVIKAEKANLAINEDNLNNLSKADKAKIEAEMARITPILLKCLDSSEFEEDDIALFGRFMPNHNRSTVVAACAVSHAIGVHGIANHPDFISAVDDNHNIGSGFTGNVDGGSNMMYHYSVVDIYQLARNKGSRGESIPSLVASYMRHFATCIPKAKMGSTANFVRPCYVLMTIKDTQPVNLANAFDAPVYTTDKGIQFATVERFEGYLRDYRQQFAETPLHDFKWCFPLTHGIPILSGIKGKVSFPAMLEDFQENLKRIMEEK